VTATSDESLIQRLFQQSIAELNAKWHGKRIDDFPIDSHGVFDSAQ
jgi:hypothetical protein